MKRLVVEKELLLHNINCLKNMAENCTILAVLKGNGYGLGIVQFAQLLMETGIRFFAVSELSEGIALRQSGIDADILLLSATCDEAETKEIIQNNIIATVGSIQSADMLNQCAETACTTAQAHIKLDTGFGRYGFLPDEIGEAAKHLKTLKNIDFCGTFSHLSDSFGKNKKHSYKQFSQFMDGVNILKEHGIQPGLIHLCNSCGFLRFPEMRLDAVRIGSAFLGRLPMPNTYGLKRVAHLEAEISEIKLLPKGHNVGYANTCTLKRETKIAVVPVGYKDGYGVIKANDTFRFLDILRYLYADAKLFLKDNTLYASVNGQRVPLLGRVGMYNIILDVTNTNIQIGDTVSISVNPLLIESSILRVYV